MEKEALHYTTMKNGRFHCHLCPHNCKISDGKQGICGVRSGKEGILVTHTYGRVSGMAYDPIEKKPLYHFLPGKKILSLGSAGCTMRCLFCQNNHISQCGSDFVESFREVTSREIVSKALDGGAPAVAFTYNEPVVSYEFMLETAALAHANGLFTAMVSNGYINRNPLLQLLPHIDAFNIDLKGFNEEFYQNICGAKLKDVLQTLEILVEAEKQMEVTFLAIGGLNDDLTSFRSMINYIADNLGRNTVLHISRYFPGHQMKLPPTPEQRIASLLEIAREKLQYVYPGNTGFQLDSNTYCKACGNVVIGRKGYAIDLTGLSEESCAKCGTSVIGLFNQSWKK